MDELLSSLEPELASILEAEISLGNTISQADRVWPRPGSICVQLRNRFKATHKIDGEAVRYVEDNDPHGPVAEYVYVASGNSLLCSLHRAYEYDI